MYSHIVFDIDGTLIDTEEAVLLSLRDTVREVLQKDIPVEDLRFAFGIPGDYALNRLGIKDIGRADLLWHELFAKYSTDIKIFDGVLETLERLAGLSCDLGILTSKTNAEYEDDLVPLGLSRYFQIVVCADDTDKHKPHPEPMMKFLEYSGAAPKNVLYVGDTIYDMQCAQGAGVDFALALWGCKKPEGIGAKHCLSDPREIIPLISR